MKKSFILFAALAALFSCTKETPVSPETPSQETYSVTLTAVAPTASDDTKTTLVEGGRFVHWSKGDAIKVMFAPQLYYSGSTVVNGSDVFDSPGQVLTSYFEEDAAQEAQFRIDDFKIYGSNKKWYKQTGIALYPYTATATSKKNGYLIETDVFYSLPNEQTAVKDNIESNLNFAYADVDLYEFTGNSMPELQFKNACSLIKLTMPQSFDDKKVVSVTIESNDGSYLSGKGTVDFKKFPGEFKVSVAGDSKNPGVTLVNETGFKAGASYYAVVWPGEHSGLTFTFTAEDGVKATVTTSKAVNLQASHVKPYTFKSALQFEEGESWVYYAPGEGTGKYYYDNGTVGDNPAPTDRNILGVVFYNGNPRNNDTALPDYCTHGLAISLNEYSTKWGTFNQGKLPNQDYSTYGLGDAGSCWGYYSMQKLMELYSASGTLNLYTTPYGDIDLSATSGWYIPSGKEWGLLDYNAVNTSLSDCGGKGLPDGFNTVYWLPSLSSKTYARYVYFSKGSPSYEGSASIGIAKLARPIFAF